LRHRGGDAETWSAIDAAHYDVPRLLAAVDAALALPARWAAKDLHLPSSVLTEDRGWVRAECAGGLRAAILAGLTGDEASRD